jgi:hypothetical protein
MLDGYAGSVTEGTNERDHGLTPVSRPDNLGGRSVDSSGVQIFKRKDRDDDRR